MTQDFPALRLADFPPWRQPFEAMRFMPGAWRLIATRQIAPTPSYLVQYSDSTPLSIAPGDLTFAASRDELQQVRQAVLALEDRRFFSHNGIDLRGLARATWHNAKSRRIVQGGSTITQQLVRNTLLTPERSFLRKGLEAALALHIERHFTKDEILDLYCNSVYLGNGTRGFAAASRTIFRKPVGSLTAAEAVFIAGLLRAPSSTNPASDPQAFRNRSERLRQRHPELPADSVRAVNPIHTRRLRSPRIARATQNELDRLQIQRQDVSRVTTWLDSRVQSAFDQELRRASEDTRVDHIAAVALSLSSGGMIAESAWSSGRKLDFSPALHGRIQPGSTYKPFAFLSFLEQGFSSQHLLESAPYGQRIDNGSGRQWTVRNYGNTYRGRITAHHALVASDNTAFARLTELVDLSAMYSLYSSLGLCTPGVATPAIVLGGVRGGVSLLQLAAAYAFIARSGALCEPRLIRVIELRDKTWLAPAPTSRHIPISYESITALRAALSLIGFQELGIRVSGKTGTTRRASLFAGYDDRASYAVWVGFRDPVPETDPKALSALQVMRAAIHRLFGHGSPILSI